jgi:anti-anti-sigma factor
MKPFVTLAASLSNPQPDLLVLGGDIDLHASPRVREAAAKILKSKTPRIYFDLGGVTYMDSSGIAVLIETLQQAQTYGGKLALYSIPPRVRAVFEIARLDQVLELFPDAESARAAG